MRLVLAGCLLVGGAGALHAQQGVPAAPAQQRPDPRDTIPVPPFREQPPVSPLGAAWRSLLLPGWGQSVIGRRATGAAFIFWEGLALTMTVKAAHQRRYQEDTAAETAESKSQEVQDWAVVLAFNHLVAAAEAYASTHLWDFPGDLETTALPGGRIGMGLAFRW
jgi:hypothetical protein